MSAVRVVAGVMVVGCLAHGLALAQVQRLAPGVRVDANAPLPEFYFMVTGTKQGKLKGESTRAKWAEHLVGMGLDFEAKTPTAAARTVATGKTQYQPLAITRRVGVASPQLFQALATNEILATVALKFVALSAEGAEEVYYTITLKNAMVVALSQFLGPPDGAWPLPLGLMETVSLRYQSITLEHLKGGTVAIGDAE
jgi:type VI secretion system Hcp family effector